MNALRFSTAVVSTMLAIAILILSHGQSFGQQNTADQTAIDQTAVAKEKRTTPQFPNAQIPQILLEYERLTGKTIIRDASIQDKTLSVQTSKEMSYAEAAQFIEKSFLLNGYALINTRNPEQLKIIDFNTGKMPISEGLAIYTSPFQLPDSDEVVSYIMPVVNISPEAAAKAFGEIVDLHPYGKITPLEDATAIVITENSSVIKQLIELQAHIDVRPVLTIDRSFILERADAEDVAAALTEILDLDDTNNTATASRTPASARPTPGVGNNRRKIPSPTGINASAFSSAKPRTPKPKVHAIPRANHLLVVASPADMKKIEGLIMHLDAAQSGATFLKRKLNYTSVANFLPIARDTLQRGLSGGDTQQGQISGNNGAGAGNSNGQTNNSSSSGQGGSTNSSGANAAFSGLGQDVDPGPQSLVVDKTLLIADSVQNTLIVTGPPEHLRIISELLDIMDIRPEQISISVIIAQLNLGNDFEFGFDILRALETPAANGRGNNGAGSFKSRTGAAQNLFNIDTLTDVTNLLPAAQGLTFYGQINPYLDGFLSMLDATNRFKVLSRPTVYTVNNRRALIQTGQRVAVPRSTLSSVNQGVGNNQIVTSNIEFENVLLKIEVLPLINSNGEITLQINQSNDAIVGSQLISGNEIPTIGTQALGTTIMVRDGGTVLLGGLISEEDQKSESGLPLFMNVPLLGKILGSTNDNVSRQELLVFIQPKIIKNSNDQDAVDQDMLDRTRIGEDAVSFSDGTDNNLPSFESPEFDSPEKRIGFFKRIFGKKKN